ncbi:MAG: methionine gamma-lyase family protein [Oscillospiraceae bacterium]|nr:methionine gamma-lyase family protein [Oscillospiraceae bacterium]
MDIKIDDRVYQLSERAMELISGQFSSIDRIAEENTAKVMSAFRNNRVSDTCFAGTTGYGYDDGGRETLDRVYTEVFRAESALVRSGFVNGTHAICAALFASLKPGDVLLAATGAPYDTLRGAIGITGDYHGSLKFYGVGYQQVDMTADGHPDYEGIEAALSNQSIGAVEIQRSRGYSGRNALSIDEIGRICDIVHRLRPDVNIVVDNCYGEFVETREPTEVGADLCAGSLIKNPGGGIAPAGGYVVGRGELVEKAAYHLTVPGIGGECGATLGQNRLLFQGLFLAPHVVAQALKTALFCASMMELMGYKTYPSYSETRSDIIQTIEFENGDELVRFCRGIQSASPVDSFVTPEPWAMPGYDDPVVMAAGAFIQGSSIELSADGPMRPPFRAFMQGGLTFESGKLGIMLSANELLS